METFAGIVLIGGFAVLMLLKVPVSFAMLIATLGSAMVTGTNFSVMIRQLMDGANNFSLLSIPFFIVMGEFMGTGGISEKIVNLANLAVGRFRGGLAYVNVLDSMFFGGISGSAVADVSSLGSMVIPMMKKQGYDEDFAVGLTVTTSCQGVLIPPSHNMVIYALAAGGGVSIGTMFMAGATPGIALGLGIMILCFFFAKRYNFPKGNAIPKNEWKKIIIDAILPMMTLVIIMVGTRSYYTNKPVASVADMKGLKIRMQNNKMMVAMTNVLGGVGVTGIGPNEVYSAISQGTIDGAENNWPTYQNMGDYEAAPYYCLDKHTMVPEILLASEAVLDDLDEEDVAIIMACAKETQEYEKQKWAEKEASSEEIVRAAGATITELTPEAFAEFQAAMTTPVTGVEGIDDGKSLYEMYGAAYQDVIDAITAVCANF